MIVRPDPPLRTLAHPNPVNIFWNYMNFSPFFMNFPGFRNKVDHFYRIYRTEPLESVKFHYPDMKKVQGRMKKRPRSCGEMSPIALFVVSHFLSHFTPRAVDFFGSQMTRLTAQILPSQMMKRLVILVGYEFSIGWHGNCSTPGQRRRRSLDELKVRNG